MKLEQVMSRLKKLGSELYEKTLPRHGVKPPFFGVKYSDLYALQKKLGVDHALALQLFGTENHDARILATLIVDPDAITSRELDAWIRVADNHVLNDAVSGVAGRSPHARLVEIEKGLDSAPNRTRHGMNQALIAIGGYRPALRKEEGRVVTVHPPRRRKRRHAKQLCALRCGTAAAPRRGRGH